MSTLGVIPTYLRTERETNVAIRTIESFAQTSAAELLVVDDGSPYQQGVDEVETLLEALGYSLFRKSSNTGFSSTVNIGLNVALESGMDACLINADIEFIDQGWLERMEQTEADVVGALLLFPNGLIQHAGIYFSIISRSFDHFFRYAPGALPQALVPRQCPVTGALQLIRHETLSELGFYDEGFRLGWEDVDYCHTVFQSGRKCAYNPAVRAVHRESLFRGNNPSKKIVEWQLASWLYLHEKQAGRSFAEYVPTVLLDD